MAAGIIIEMSRDHVIKLSRKASIRTTNTVTRITRRDARSLSCPHADFRLVNTNVRQTPVTSILTVRIIY